MRTKLLVGVISLSVIAALAIGAGIYTTYDKKVTLAVQGKARTVHVFGNTVGDVLAKERIRIGPHDVVAPATSDKISDGTRIAVRYGRPLHLMVDGSRSTHWVTATSLGAALTQLGVRFDGADLSASRSTGIERAGLSVKVRTQKHITVVHDHKRSPVDVTALTVGEVLADAKVSLDGDDKVKPDLAAAVADGDTVTVIRISTKLHRVKIEIPFQTERKSDSSMLKGHSSVDQAGKPGLRVRVLRLRYVDGKQTKETLLREKVARQPVNQVIRYGVKEPPPPPPPPSDSGDSGSSGGGGGPVGGGADSLNWAALAQCESGGNPRAVSPGGTYFGLYQFSLSTWQAVGGSGNPIDNSAGEQTYRAKILYQRSGSGQWPVCGSRLYS